SLSLGRSPKVSEVAEALSISVKKLRELQTQARKPLSLDMKIGSEQNTALGELLEDEGMLPEEYATRSLLKFDLKQLLQTLNDQQQEVIRRRFGLDADSKMTLRQVGECMGLSPERVRQVERAALRRLRKRARGLKEYMVAS
ncbi:MAG: sigma-70 domain-containing protein, partial [Cyanobacteria bacterium J06598_3]